MSPSTLLRKTLVSAVILGTLIVIPAPFNPVLPAHPAQEPTLLCGVGGNPVRECSFILWSESNGKITGSRGFVVAPGTQNPIGNAYLGFKFCMHAAPPRAPMPQWPSPCWKGDNRTYWTPTDTYGVVKPGPNG